MAWTDCSTRTRSASPTTFRSATAARISPVFARYDAGEQLCPVPGIAKREKVALTGEDCARA